MERQDFSMEIFPEATNYDVASFICHLLKGNVYYGRDYDYWKFSDPEHGINGMCSSEAVLFFMNILNPILDQALIKNQHKPDPDLFLGMRLTKLRHKIRTVSFMKDTLFVLAEMVRKKTT